MLKKKPVSHSNNIRSPPLEVPNEPPTSMSPGITLTVMDMVSPVVMTWRVSLFRLQRVFTELSIGGAGYLNYSLHAIL